MNVQDIQNQFLRHVQFKIEGAHPLDVVEMGKTKEYWECCWIWKGPIVYTDLMGQERSAKRYAKELFDNDVIPHLMEWEGTLKIINSCCESKCCNPKHLRWAIVPAKGVRARGGKKLPLSWYNEMLERGILRARILQKISKTDDGHWIWVGGRNSSGYPVIQSSYINGKQKLSTAHRMVWSLWNRDAQAVCNSLENQGKQLRVQCSCSKGLLCVAPDHLTIST